MVFNAIFNNILVIIEEEETMRKPPTCRLKL